MSYQVVASIVVTLLGVGLGAGLLAYELWFKKQEQPYKDNSYNYTYTSEDNIRRTPYRNEYDDECTICHEKMEGSQKKKLICGHVYHLTCIREWFQRDILHRCPICRNPNNKL